jgi:bis(5'-nucleosidyl)-tetraphosphatase
MGYEISAGVILFRYQPSRQYLVLDYGSHWDFPKGHLEAGEDLETTAQRELQEETGVRDARFLPGYQQRICYFYRRAGERMQKEVVFFLAETPHGDVTISQEHCGYAWLPCEAALRRLTFKSARDLLTAAERFLQHHSPNDQ